MKSYEDAMATDTRHVAKPSAAPVQRTCPLLYPVNSNEGVPDCGTPYIGDRNVG